jgi:hypothetical protein
MHGISAARAILAVHPRRASCSSQAQRPRRSCQLGISQMSARPWSVRLCGAATTERALCMESSSAQDACREAARIQACSSLCRCRRVRPLATGSSSLAAESMTVESEMELATWDSQTHRTPRCSTRQGRAVELNCPDFSESPSRNTTRALTSRRPKKAASPPASKPRGLYLATGLAA